MPTYANYPRIIAEWCSRTGMTPWATDDVVHVSVDSVVIGLAYNADEQPETLHAFIDLGPPDAPDLPFRLLGSNGGEIIPGNGYFGIHPQAGTVVYRVDLPLTADVDGASLPGHLKTHAELARARLQG